MNASRRHPHAGPAKLIGALALAIVALLSILAAPALAGEVHGPSGSLGEPGSGNGQLALSEHSGLAVNQTSHDVYVADTGNGRVEEFSAAGAFVRTFGSLAHPTFVAIDNSGGASEGDVYVVDSGNAIFKFSAGGSAIGSWGSAGALTGFSSIAGVAVDTAGNLFVLEESGSVVRKYSAAGLKLSSFEAPRGTTTMGLAVDSEGNLYKADGNPEVTKFTGTGESLGEPDLRGDAAALAIDPSNDDLYVVQGAEGGFVNRFAVNCGQGCAPLEEFGTGELSSPQGVAIDPASHDVYVANAGTSKVGIFSLEYIASPAITVNTPTAVEYSTAHVSGTVNPEGTSTTCRFEYVTEAHFQTEGFAGAQSTPCATNPGSGTVAVNVAADLGGLVPGTVYHVRLAAKNAGGTAFSAEPNQTLETKAITTPPPSVSINPLTAMTPTTAHFSGHINPNAPGSAPQDPAFDVNWHFECSPSCGSAESVSTLNADNTSHEVSVEATGLEPGSAYEVKLVAESAAGSVSVGPVALTTLAAAPRVDSTAFSAPSVTGATLDAEINPGGAATTYHFEYVTEEQFEEGEFSGAEITPESVSIGSDNKDHPVSAAIAGLQPSIAYRFRVVASNEIKTVDGPVSTLFTYESTPIAGGCPNEILRGENASLNLPDCRAFEQVSLASHSDAYQPYVPSGVVALSVSTPYTGLFFGASSQGDVVTYAGEPSPSGQGGGTGNSGEGEGDQQLARRGENGWNTSDISPLGSRTGSFYQYFSNDLSSGILRTEGKGLLAPGIETNCPNSLYSRDNSTGAFSSLLSGGQAGICGSPFFVGASVNGSHLLFESAAAVLPGTQEAQGEGHENIYDFSAGQLHLVNVLPGANPAPDPNATAGNLVGRGPYTTQAQIPGLNTANVISASGSRIFWTDLTTGALYARENDTQPQSAIGPSDECTEPAKACTVQIDAPETATGSGGESEYQTATPDGSRVYFTESASHELTADTVLGSGQNLYEYDFQKPEGERLTDLTVDSTAEALGVIGVNQTGATGSYLYFVASGALAGSGQNSDGQTPTEGEPNLYVIHTGQIKFIDTLASGDNSFGGTAYEGFDRTVGDWKLNSGLRSAQVSADGSGVVVTSTQRLTSYENRGAVEIYIYDATSGQVSCASCDPTGMPGEGSLSTYLRLNYASIIIAPRFISASGDRVFFNTARPISAADDNTLLDVYEWERQDSGTCDQGSPAIGGGCVYLVSGGEAETSSAFIDADESGANVFFVTRSQLAAGDHEETSDIYDARVNGGFPAVAEAIPCEVEACRGPQQAPPVSQTPGSSTFSGAGNQVEPAHRHHKRNQKKRHHRKRAANHKRGGAK